LAAAKVVALQLPSGAGDEADHVVGNEMCRSILGIEKEQW